MTLPPLLRAAHPRPRHRRARRSPRATAAATAALLVSATLVGAAGGADAATSTLPGNATIGVTITSPTAGSSVPYGQSVTVSGKATISDVGGNGTPPPADAVLVTVVDLSGSTVSSASTTACGDPNNDGQANRIDDCEIAAASALNQQAAAVGTIADVGIVGFSTQGAAADVSPASGIQRITSPVADLNGNGTADAVEVFRSMRGSNSRINQFTQTPTGNGSTNFTEALKATTSVLSASTRTKRIVAFLSDGLPTQGGQAPTAFQQALDALPPGTVVYTFAVGGGSACTPPNGSDTYGSLQSIADQTGGTCTVVTNPGNLPNILPSIFKPKLNTVSLTVDGGAPVAVTTTPALPVTGPATVDYSKVVSGLLPGDHEICVTAAGVDAGGPGSATECTTVTVERAASSISTDASPSVPVGTGTLSDTATVSSALTPTGAVTFTLYGPGDPTCTGAPVFTDEADLAATVDGDQVAMSDGFAPATAGTYRWVASYGGDSQSGPASGECGDPGETVVVTKADASIVTAASQSVVVGAGQISDTAQVSGHNPTGEVTFDLYGPDDATCTGPVVFTSTVDLGADGKAASAEFAPTSAGTYRWIASYSGDANNTSAAGACNDTGEETTVEKAAPSIKTEASDEVRVGDGGSLADTAEVVGGYGPTGTVTFRLYGPGDTTCSDPVFTSTVDLAGNTAISEGHVPTAAGFYRWVASYSGDANNKAASGVCGDPAELAVVSKARPQISTSATEFAVVGQQPIGDTATVTGGYSPTGTVSFAAFGPDDTACTGTPAFEATEPLVDGKATTPGFTATAPGIYRWVAAYNGDSNNTAAWGSCADPAERSVVGKVVPTLTTNASANVPVGGKVHDKATLTSAYTPTGQVDFALYGPADQACTGTPVFATSAPLAGGAATSPSYVVTAPGTYHWIASYGGDAFNEGVTGACGDAGETVVVTPQVLTGRASAVDVAATVLGLPLIPIHLQNTGNIATTQSASYGNATCIDVDAEIVTATALCSRVVTDAAYPSRSTATSTVASATVGVSLLPAITVKAVETRSTTTCQGSAGSTTIAYLKVGSTVVIAQPTKVAPNTVINVGVVRLVLNEQIPFTTPDAGLTVNAVHATANALVARADIVIASAESDIGNCPAG